MFQFFQINDLNIYLLILTTFIHSFMILTRNLIVLCGVGTGRIVFLQRLKLLRVRTLFLKKEGGLGLKNLKVWNKSSMLRHI